MRSRTMMLWSAMSLVAAACGDEEPALLRAAHLAPDAPAVSIYAGDEPVPLVASLELGQGTELVVAPEDLQTLRIAPEGAGPGAALITLDQFALFAGEEYTVVVYGTLDESDEFPLTAEILVDDLPALQPGEIAVRPVHVAPGVGDVDVWALGGATPVLLADELAYGEAGDYVVVPSGNDVLALDLDEDKSPDLAFPVGVRVPGAAWTGFVGVDEAGAPFLLAQPRDGTAVLVPPSPQQ